MDKAWFGLPETEEMIEMVKAFYSPEEARLLTGFPFANTDLEEIAEMKDMAPEELGSKLDEMARKGMVWRSQKTGRTRYKINDAAFVFYRSAFWHGRADETTSAVAPLINKYHLNDFMEQYAHANNKGLRTIPIERTIGDTRQVMPYEDVVHYLDTQDYFTVSFCPCRTRKKLDLDSRHCDHPTEVCLHFGALGRYIVENGLGREITKAETRAILKRSAELGLVHGISNVQEGGDTICNCCACGCMFLEAYHVLGHHRGLDPSNYIAEVSPETCKGCGLCVKRCPMDALQLKRSTFAKNKVGKVAVLDQELCIGCGVCAYKCPTDSLALERREKTEDPPMNNREWIKRFMADKESGPKYRYPRQDPA